MERIGDTIHFDDRDRNRFGELPASMPAAEVPAVFKLAGDRRQNVAREISYLVSRHDQYGLSEDQHQAAMQSATLRSNALLMLQSDLMRHAAEELVDDLMETVVEHLAAQAPTAAVSTSEKVYA